VGKLKSPLRNSYGRHHPLRNVCITDDHEYTSNSTGIRSGAGTAYIFGAHLGLVVLNLPCSVFFNSCCSYLFFYFGHCLSFFNLRCRVTPLVS